MKRMMDEQNATLQSNIQSINKPASVPSSSINGKEIINRLDNAIAKRSKLGNDILAAFKDLGLKLRDVRTDATKALNSVDDIQKTLQPLSIEMKALRSEREKLPAVSTTAAFKDQDVQAVEEEAVGSHNMETNVPRKRPCPGLDTHPSSSSDTRETHPTPKYLGVVSSHKIQTSSQLDVYVLGRYGFGSIPAVDVPIEVQQDIITTIQSFESKKVKEDTKIHDGRCLRGGLARRNPSWHRFGV